MARSPIDPPRADDGSDPPKTGGVIAVDRALSILDAFVAAPGAVSLSDLARATGLVKPTVLRSLVSLEKAGYVLRTEDRRYQLGAKALQLGMGYTRTFRLDAVVLPALRRLTADTGETASFLIREAGQRICLFRVESPHRVRDVADVNVATPLDETSGSRALMHDATDDGAERPVFFTSGLNDVQSASISTPIYRVDQLAGALSLSAPINRLDLSKAEQYAQALTVVAATLTTQLGGHRFVANGFRLLVDPVKAAQPKRRMQRAGA